jgi:hypothetical protein
MKLLDAGSLLRATDERLLLVGSTVAAHIANVVPVHVCIAGCCAVRLFLWFPFLLAIHFCLGLLFFLFRDIGCVGE